MSEPSDKIRQLTNRVSVDEPPISIIVLGLVLLMGLVAGGASPAAGLAALPIGLLGTLLIEMMLAQKREQQYPDDTALYSSNASGSIAQRVSAAQKRRPATRPKKVREVRQPRTRQAQAKPTPPRADQGAAQGQHEAGAGDQVGQEVGGGDSTAGDRPPA